MLAIDGLDPTIDPYEVHGLIGPNGRGKTTTLYVMTGYYAPQEGVEPLAPLIAPARRAQSAPPSASQARSRRRA